MKNGIKKLVLSAMFLAMGVVLPMFIGQIPRFGTMLLPMHIPVFLCGLICGRQYGAPMAAILPLLRSLLFGIPNFYPDAIAIAFEMAAYAFAADLLYSRSKWHCIKSLYRCLLISMIVGRIVRGTVQFILLGISGSAFTFKAFFFGIVVTGIPGIILQLIIIPAVMIALHKTKLMPLRNEHKECKE